MKAWGATRAQTTHLPEKPLACMSAIMPAARTQAGNKQDWISETSFHIPGVRVHQGHFGILPKEGEGSAVPTWNAAVWVLGCRAWGRRPHCSECLGEEDGGSAALTNACV